MLAPFSLHYRPRGVLNLFTWFEKVMKSKFHLTDRDDEACRTRARGANLEAWNLERVYRSMFSRADGHL